MRTYDFGDLVTVLPTADHAHLTRAEADYRRTVPGMVTGVARDPHGGQLLTVAWGERGGRGRYEPADLVLAPVDLEAQLAGEWAFYEAAVAAPALARLDRPYASPGDLVDIPPVDVPAPRVWVAVDVRDAVPGDVEWFPLTGDGGWWVEVPCPGASLHQLADEAAYQALDLCEERGDAVGAARARVYARPQDAAHADHAHLTVVRDAA